MPIVRILVQGGPIDGGAMLVPSNLPPGLYPIRYRQATYWVPDTDYQGVANELDDRMGEPAQLLWDGKALEYRPKEVTA